MPKLKWIGSGKGAGYYIDLYETEDGRKVIIGTERDDPILRKEIADPSFLPPLTDCPNPG